MLVISSLASVGVGAVASPDSEQITEFDGDKSSLSRANLAPASPSTFIDVDVSSKSNIYASGRDKVPDFQGGGGVMPVEIDVSEYMYVSFPKVNGSAKAGSDFPNAGPDGSPTETTNLDSYDGISGIIHDRSLFLVGVFLSDSSPSSPAPERLDFTSGDNFTTLSPEIAQTFFVGDGVNNKDGVVQSFEVPQGATKLYLGIADGPFFKGDPGYYDDNTGGFDVTVANGTPVSSTFDADKDGWLVVGDAQGGEAEPDYVSSGGNPGAYLSAEDDVTGGTWYWSAPDKFLGDKTNSYNMALTYDLKQSSTTNPHEDFDVRISGESMTIAYDFGDESTHPGTDWTHYKLILNESGWTDLNQNPVTKSEFEQVLSNVTKLWIRGEYRSGSDTGGLDNPMLFMTTKTKTLTVLEAIANMDTQDDMVSFAELQSAISYWVTGQTVPGTGGEILTFSDLQQLISLWVSGNKV